MERNINRIKVVLVDKRKTNKWLSEQLGVAPTTVSKWCTNVAQPPLGTLMQIAKLLGVQVDDLLRFEELPSLEMLNVTEKTGQRYLLNSPKSFRR